MRGDAEIAEAVRDAATDATCGHLEQCLAGQGIDVLHDDTDARAGSKFATMDLVGIPWQVVVGPRGLANGVVELKRRATGEREEVSIESALARLTA